MDPMGRKKSMYSELACLYDRFVVITWVEGMTNICSSLAREQGDIGIRKKSRNSLRKGHIPKEFKF